MLHGGHIGRLGNTPYNYFMRQVTTMVFIVLQVVFMVFVSMCTKRIYNNKKQFILRK